MEIKALKSEKSIRRVNWFFFITIVWSVFTQFLPIPANSYQYIAFLIPISIYLLLNKDKAERMLKPNILNIKSIIIIFFIWLSSLPIVFLVIDLYIYFFGNALPDMVSQDIHDYFLINVFFTAITPAVLEEILLRGIILDGYRNKSRFVAALANGLLFGILHLNSFQFFHTFLSGFLASYLVMATNSIFAGIFIHTINNGFPLIINYLYPLDPDIAYATSPSILLYFFYGLIGIILTYLLIRLLFKVNKTPWKEEKEFSKERIFNLPMILSILVFLVFSFIIILALLGVL